MMDIEKLRKADIFSGTAILLLGLFIISQAVQMPMKDSYAGVQNVWYVSPALLPLFIGAMLALLGVLLMKTALKAVGLRGLNSAMSFLGSSAFISFLKQQDTLDGQGCEVGGVTAESVRHRACGAGAFWEWWKS